MLAKESTMHIQIQMRTALAVYNQFHDQHKIPQLVLGKTPDTEYDIASVSKELEIDAMDERLTPIVNNHTHRNQSKIVCYCHQNESIGNQPFLSVKSS